MSYYEALQDGIHMERDSKGFQWYYPPCKVCGTPVGSWSYIRGMQYVCENCRHELVELEHMDKLDMDKKQRKLKTAIKRISGKTNITPYEKAIEWVEEHLQHSGWFQSTEEIMVALELIRRKIKAHHQVKVFNYFVDFILPEFKVALEIDGKPFHSKDKAEEEKIRDEIIIDKLGADWEMIRIDTDNINTNITRLVPAIKSVLKYRKKKAGF